MISSTYFDLADARARLRTFLEGLGHEPLLHEAPGFGVTPGKHSHAACLDQVDNADYMVLVVGGRRGGTYVESLKSITNEEYRRAVERKIPIFIFVKRDIETASTLYKANPKGDFSKVVDDVRIFDFLDVIKSASLDNWVRPFDNVEDIVEGLRGQFAYVHKLFSDDHVRGRTRPSSSPGVHDRGAPFVPFPSDFGAIIDSYSTEEAAVTISGLKQVHAVLRKMREAKVDGYGEKVKTLWLLGRHGTVEPGSSSLSMRESSFRQHAWGSTKGRRVFEQLGDFGIDASYEQDQDLDGRSVSRIDLAFEDGGEDALYALRNFVRDLAEKYGDDDGLAFFGRGDMTIYGVGANAEELWSLRDLRKAKAAARTAAEKVKRKAAAPAAPPPTKKRAK